MAALPGFRHWGQPVRTAGHFLLPYGREEGSVTRTRATTIVAVRRGGRVAMAGDGQVTVGDVVMKRQARKIRRLHHDTVLAGFAGSAADGITLLDRFEAQLE